MDGKACPPPVKSEVESLFLKYAENGMMKPAQVHKFQVEVQGENSSTNASAQQAMQRFLHENPNSSAKPNPPIFTKDSFLDFLFDPKYNPSIDSRVHHDMTAPLSHYYIYTGHNSYLTGNQLSSDCSEKPIIDSLSRGVRVIELDLWPSSTKDEVLVLHGRTLTSPVEFKTCISAIKQHAFSKSQYPVVITLEDHLTSSLQANVVEVLTKSFGDVLHLPESTERLKEFLSPESLKGKILISTKPPKEYLAGKKGEASKNITYESGKNEGKQKDHTIWGDEIPEFMQDAEIEAKHSAGDIGGDEDDDEEEEEEEGAEKESSSAAVALAPEYRRIIAIQSGKPKGDSLKDALVQADDLVRRVSLSEPQLRKLAQSYPALLVQFTQKNILRIYPYGLRFDSSNYNPLLAWSHGAQMVAFNMQGYGKPLWLVHGFFRANGGCGYVKKPEFLLKTSDGAQTESVFNPDNPRPIRKILKVKVYMGRGWQEKFGKTYFDTFSAPDFYARVGIAGVAADCTKMEETAVAEDSWKPCWDSPAYEFPLNVPELALLRIEVQDHNKSRRDEFAGQTCLPVSELKHGVRCVQLFDEKGLHLPGVKLLCFFHLREA